MALFAFNYYCYYTTTNMTTTTTVMKDREQKSLTVRDSLFYPFIDVIRSQ
jgi:hypothetical protein